MESSKMFKANENKTKATNQDLTINAELADKIVNFFPSINKIQNLAKTQPSSLNNQNRIKELYDSTKDREKSVTNEEWEYLQALHTVDLINKINIASNKLKSYEFIIKVDELIKYYGNLAYNIRHYTYQHTSSGYNEQANRYESESTTKMPGESHKNDYLEVGLNQIQKARKELYDKYDSSIDPSTIKHNIHEQIKKIADEGKKWVDSSKSEGNKTTIYWKMNDNKSDYHKDVDLRYPHKDQVLQAMLEYLDKKIDITQLSMVVHNSSHYDDKTNLLKTLAGTESETKKLLNIVLNYTGEKLLSEAELKSQKIISKK